MTDVVIPILACGHDASVFYTSSPGQAVCSKWCGLQDVVGRKVYPA